MAFHSRSFQVKTFVKPATWCKVEATLLIGSETSSYRVFGNSRFWNNFLQMLLILPHLCVDQSWWMLSMYKEKWDYKHHYSKAIEHQPNYQSFAVNLFSPALYFLFISAGVLLYFYGEKKRKKEREIYDIGSIMSRKCQGPRVPG